MTTENYFMTKFGTTFSLKEGSQNTVKFIHASDIHFGAAQYRNEYRSDDFIQAFQVILELAIIHHVDFIILGGDVFTSLEILPGKLTIIVDMLRAFDEFTDKSISIIAIEGNHDIRKFSRGIRFEQRGQSWLKLLNSLGLIILLDADLDAPSQEIFPLYNFVTKKGGKIQIKNVVIYGSRYLGERPITFLSKIGKAIVKDNNLYNILLQHFGIEGQMENVPGIKLEEIQHLQHLVNYLALGHFHKQFILEDWIYNPGSSEAACSIDNSFKRGIFLVEVSKKFEKFVKTVKMIRLINRKYIWKTLHLSFEITSKIDLELIIINKLKSLLRHLNNNLHPTNPRMPILYLLLKGMKPSCKINEKELREKICDTFPIIDVRIYQKFKNSLKTLDKYLLV
ncbi:MAG: exonuclease SbcCD subunit D [Candidatus Thorarchaeota archaeon]